MENEKDNIPDLVIIERVLKGETEIFEVLMDRYAGLVLMVLKKHLPPDQIEETAQEVFVRAYQSLKNFKGQSEFPHWLSVISVRTSYDYWRKHYRNRETPMSTLPESHRMWLENSVSDNPLHSISDRSSQKEAQEVLEWVLADLSAEDRMVIELVYLQELSGKEAAELLGWSVANVKVRSFRARKKLEKKLRTIMERGN